MLFSSLVFVFVFLPLTAAVYFLLPRRGEWRNWWLLLMSILFYAWGEPKYVAIMLATVVLNWLGAVLLEKCGRGKQALLALTVLADLSVLVYFKYFNFLAENFNALFQTHVDFIKVVMPIGISFYTFQALSYVVDVYRGEVKAQRNVLRLALYISLFPQLVAGPIVKYHDVAEQIVGRTVSLADFAGGLRRFITGLAKKMLIANTMGAIADSVYAQTAAETSCAVAWLGAVAYALQIYYDFSGYSDMAIGLGRMFGFRFLENFNYPYISRSITEFWRRWHISLSTWFKEYLYIPLGGNRVGSFRLYANLLIVFLATGVWHGASWNFVVWGLWNGFFIVLERLTGFHKREGGFVFTALKHLYVVAVFLLGWVFFRADNLSLAFAYLKNMFGLVRHADAVHPCFVSNFDYMILALGMILACPIVRDRLYVDRGGLLRRLALDGWLVVLFALSVAWMVGATYNPFIYFRF